MYDVSTIAPSGEEEGVIEGEGVTVMEGVMDIEGETETDGVGQIPLFNVILGSIEKFVSYCHPNTGGNDAVVALLVNPRVNDGEPDVPVLT